MIDELVRGQMNWAFQYGCPRGSSKNNEKDFSVEQLGWVLQEIDSELLWSFFYIGDASTTGRREIPASSSGILFNTRGWIGLKIIYFHDHSSQINSYNHHGMIDSQMHIDDNERARFGSIDFLVASGSRSLNVSCTLGCLDCRYCGLPSKWVDALLDWT